MVKQSRSKTKKNNSKGKQSDFQFVFRKENYRWLLIGAAVVVLGFALMTGNTDELFVDNKFTFNSHIKVTLAPILVLVGFAIQGYAIMKRPKSVEKDELS